MKRLIKKWQGVSHEFIAYNNESFLDRVSELGENLLNKETVATDTLEIGDLKLHWALQSPIRVQNNGETTTIGFSAGTSVEIGITMKNGRNGGGNCYPGLIPGEANPFFDPSEGSSGEGDGHRRRPRG